jgi:cell fate regulator YaaT (PSP1 superfamily)
MQNNEPDVQKKPEPDQKRYYRVKVLHSSETQVCGWIKQPLQPDTEVIVNSRYGRDLGRVLGPLCSCPNLDRNNISDIVRVATEKDLKSYDNSKRRENEALEICREKVKHHNLDMKLVSAHFLSDESKVLFFFTADERVDFRALVKDLVSVFKMRIELRQIGVRDESRVIGGLAVCGRPFCCHQITDKLRPVSIKMAKEQNLSLNSMKISGPCGRLLCCLSYEYDFYKEEKGKLPSEGSWLKIEDTMFRVQEVNLLSRVIRLAAQDGRMKDLPFHSVTRNEKNRRWEVAENKEPSN